MATAENNNQGAQMPAVQKAQQNLDATGAFVSIVKAEENRHAETITEMINRHIENFGSGLRDFVEGLFEKAGKAYPKDSFLGACVNSYVGYQDLKVEGRKADLKHMEAEDQIKILEAQERLVAAQNTAKQLDLQLAEVNRDKAEAEARVSERFDSFKDRIKSFEDRLKEGTSTTTGTTTGPCPATPERKLTKNA